ASPTIRPSQSEATAVAGGSASTPRAHRADHSLSSLSLVLGLDHIGEIDWELVVGERTATGQITQEGQEIWIEIHALDERVHLNLLGHQAGDFILGALGPSDSEQGALNRLANVGECSPSAAASQAGGTPPEPEDSPLQRLLSAFQFRQALDVTGQLDAATVAKLEAAYGA
ncbi:MAG: hypothetical protein V3V08_24850, partial [Nannocystaceae bacterium]